MDNKTLKSSIKAYCLELMQEISALGGEGAYMTKYAGRKVTFKDKTSPTGFETSPKNNYYKKFKFRVTNPYPRKNSKQLWKEIKIDKPKRIWNFTRYIPGFNPDNIKVGDELILKDNNGNIQKETIESIQNLFSYNTFNTYKNNKYNEVILSKINLNNKPQKTKPFNIPKEYKNWAYLIKDDKTAYDTFNYLDKLGYKWTSGLKLTNYKFLGVPPFIIINTPHGIAHTNWYRYNLNDIDSEYKLINPEDFDESSLNESKYTQFKKQTTKPSSKEVLHRAIKEIYQKLDEINNHIEYTSKIKGSEDKEINELNNLKNSLLKIKSKINEIKIENPSIKKLNAIIKYIDGVEIIDIDEFPSFGNFNLDKTKINFILNDGDDNYENFLNSTKIPYTKQQSQGTITKSFFIPVKYVNIKK